MIHNKLYKFTSNTKVYNSIKGVSIKELWNEIYNEYDGISKLIIYKMIAYAEKESDLVLFMLANPHLNLVKKDV